LDTHPGAVSAQNGNFLVCAFGTVQEVMDRLRRNHKIGDFSRIKHHIIFPAHQFASLSLADKLKDVGICDFSVLHVGTSVLGGSSGEKTSGWLLLSCNWKFQLNTARWYVCFI
jgi:hypothetical protein